MHIILRIFLSIFIIAIHFVAIYYFYSAHWVVNSDLLIIWVSFIQVGISMSLLFYLGFLLKTPTTSKYFDFNKHEINGKIYKKLGIKAFKFILLNSPFVLLNKGLKLKKNDKAQISQLEKKMKIVEFGHLIGAIMVFAIMPIMFYRSWKFSIWLMIFNILFHIYPIFLQRYNRLRIERIMRKPVANNV